MVRGGHARASRTLDVLGTFGFFSSLVSMISFCAVAGGAIMGGEVLTSTDPTGGAGAATARLVDPDVQLLGDLLSFNCLLRRYGSRWQCHYVFPSDWEVLIEFWNTVDVDSGVQPMSFL